MLDFTHGPDRRSWVESANDPDTDFPIQNLPLGVERGGRIVTAIGDEVFDTGRTGLLNGLGGDLRHELSAALERGATPRPERLMSDVELVLPYDTRSFTDFYAGIHHARAATKILRPGSDLQPNYAWVPIAYQGRSSSLRVSGAPVKRPHGQLGPGEFAPCAKLDFELELGFFVSGTPQDIRDAPNHITGFVLLNDWSARDIQRWEMAPLGPFLSKSFATTISPWVVTPAALEPFRVAPMAHDEGPLPYLSDPADQGLDIELEVRVNGEPVTHSNARHLYWTPAQMLTHHASNGCRMEPGDLLGTGTISGPEPDQLGSLLELTADSRYLQDGDTVTFTARCTREGFASIGFGECTGTVI
jgi:fumarylacetoacetase